MNDLKNFWRDLRNDMKKSFSWNFLVPRYEIEAMREMPIKRQITTAVISVALAAILMWLTS